MIDTGQPVLIYELHMEESMKICIIGLGYVGLPLAVEFGKKYDTIGFDVKEKRIDELKRCVDRTLEIEANEIKKAERLNFTSKISDTKDCSFFIIDFFHNSPCVNGSTC